MIAIVGKHKQDGSHGNKPDQATVRETVKVAELRAEIRKIYKKREENVSFYTKRIVSARLDTILHRGIFTNDLVELLEVSKKYAYKSLENASKLKFGTSNVYVSETLSRKISEFVKGETEQMREQGKELSKVSKKFSKDVKKEIKKTEARRQQLKRQMAIIWVLIVASSIWLLLVVIAHLHG